MFEKCENITYLDLSYFNTINVNYMRLIFNKCTNLRKINLSSLILKML